MTPPLKRPAWTVGLMSLATLLSTFLPLLAVLWVARQVAPSIYGVYAAWLASVAMGTVFLGLRLDASVPLEPEGLDRLQAAHRVAALMAFFGLLTGLAVFALFLADILSISQGVIALAGVGAALLLAWTGLGQVLLSAEGRFIDLARFRIVQAFALSGSQVLAVSIAPSAEALILAYIAGAWLGLLLMPIRLVTRRWQALLEAPAYLKRHRRFAIYSLPSALVGTAAEQLPLVLMGARFGAEAAGLFGLAKRALDAAISVAVTVASDAFRRTASTAVAEHRDYRKDFDRMAAGLGLFAMTLVLGVVLTHDVIFGLTFGERWSAAGAFFLALVPIHALKVLASPLSQSYLFSGQQAVESFWQCGLLVLAAVPWLLSETLTSALAWFVGPVSVWYAIYLAGARRFTRLPAP